MTPSNDDFAALSRLHAEAGTEAMFDALAVSLAARRRWHAVFDARLMQARVALGLPPVGMPGDVPANLRDRLDDRSLAACREVGWPLLDEGQVAAAWMYLRAAADPAAVSGRLATLAESLGTAQEDDEDASRTMQEIIGVTLWEGADPALGIDLVLRTQGTCNAITAFEQAVSRLPAARQQPAAAVLVAHLHREVAGGLAGERHATTAAASITPLIDAAGGEAPLVVDVSHLQSILRIARICTDEPTIRRCWELADYACRLPAEVAYPGEPPFENVGEASRLFYSSQIGIEVEQAVRFFRTAAATAGPEAGSLPGDVLVLLLARLGRPGEALHAALSRSGADGGMPSVLQAAAALPSLVDLAAASGEWELLRRACRDRGDEITFVATLVAERQKGRNRGPQERQPAQGDVA
ncbi:MAG: hypothetical protein ACKOC8_10055 [Pirellulales bacterium]